MQQLEASTFVSTEALVEKQTLEQFAELTTPVAVSLSAPITTTPEMMSTRIEDAELQVSTASQIGESTQSVDCPC